MKKIFCILFIIFIGLQSYADELFELSTFSTYQVNGTVKSRGNTDYIILDAQTRVIGKLIVDNGFFDSSPKRTLNQESAYVPYYIKVDGITYIMIIDKNTNEWSKDDILGIEDNVNSLFTGIKNLESDGKYGKITVAELKKANVRFAKIKDGNTVLVRDKSQDFDLNKIDYIDVRSCKKIANCEDTGMIGHFNVYLKTGNNSKKIIVGYSSLESLHKLNMLFVVL